MKKKNTTTATATTATATTTATTATTATAPGGVIVQGEKVIDADGVIKTYRDNRRAERAVMRDQLKRSCARVAAAVKDAVAHMIEQKQKKTTFDLNGCFKKSWITADTTIRDTLSGERLTVMQAEKLVLLRFLRSMRADMLVTIRINGKIDFDQKAIGVKLTGDKLSARLDDALNGLKLSD